MENMTEKKMTQKDFYAAIAAIEGLDADLVAYAEAAIEKIDARNEKAKAKRAEKVKEVKVASFTPKEAKERGASGHVLAISNYKPGRKCAHATSASSTQTK